MTVTETCWTVGALARRTGLSIRTLHHYDEIGLLSPMHRSEAGYRLYSAADLARLQQIKSLRALRFSLEEIRTLLQRPDVSALRVLELHLTRLREDMALQRELCARLEAIAAHLAVSEEISADEFFHTLEVMTMMDRIKTYYTPAQLETLEQRRRQPGEEEIRRVEGTWPELIAAMRGEMERGTDPADPRVQTLAAQWKALVEAFTGGDEGIADTLGTVYRNEPEAGARFGLDGELFAYVGRAMEPLSS